MKHSQTRSAVTLWIKPLLLTAVAALLVGGCKSETSGTPAPPSGGMPPPPSGGMPAPPSPPSGGQSGSQSGSESSGQSGSESGSQSGGQSGSGMPPMGSGMPGGSEGPTGSSGDPGGSGEVGSFPSDAGGQPPGSQGGADGADGESEGESDGDEQSNSSGDCGDTGALPGGVGGMGQAGECIGGGAAASAESPSEAVAGTGGAGSVGQFPVEGDAERAERLGRELEESIGGFDEILMEEQREISSVGRNTEGFGDGSAGSAGSISLGEQAVGGTISVANTGISRESPIDGMSVEDVRERTPEDIAITVDDDIIARQLREAALVEQDPELRERLWEEYRKYTQL